MRLLSAIVLTTFFTQLASARQLDEAGADALAKAALAAWDVPGCSIVVVNRERVLYLKGHGTRAIGGTDPVTPNTIFPLASCTKAFTATLLGQLADAGILQWDDPVNKRLPRFKLTDPLADAGVTLRDLMCHRTGLASHDFLWYRSPYSQEDLVRRAGYLPSNQLFRTAFQYQSVMVSAAGLAAAKSAGAPWDQLLKTRLIDPLGMRATSCVTPTSGELATPHRPDASGKIAAITCYEQREPNPSGSIHATARDLGPWLMFQLGDGQWKGKRLISVDGLKETHTPHMVQRLEGAAAATHPETTQMSYGLGWVIQDYRGQLLWTHTGVIDGFRAQIALAPKAGFGIAILSNRHETRMNLALVNSFLDRLLELPPLDWNQHLLRVVTREQELAREARAERDRQRQPGPPPRPMTEYAGQFENPAYGKTTITVDGTALRFQWNSFAGLLVFHRGDVFELAITDLQEPLVTFHTSGDRVIGFQLFDVMFTRH
jgi:CubicO group peptidase (beta-lactamase class C family)